MKINVLHLLLSLDFGGAERVVSLMLDKSRSKEINYSVCCIDSIGCYGEDLINKGFSVNLIKRNKGIDFALPVKIAKLIHEKKINIIHAHGETPWFYSVLAKIVCIFNRVKCITTIHGYGGGDRDVFKNKLLWKFLMFFSNKTIVVSEKLSEEINKIKPFFKDRIKTIINGIDIKSIALVKKQSKKYWKIDNKTTTIGIVARLSAVKNHRILLQAVSELLKQGREVKLFIVGDGPEMGCLKCLSKQLGITKKVIFTGMRNDAVSFYPLFDIFVLPSLSEGISMTILEAMASRVPVIASNVGGNREIIEHGKNGMLFKSDDLNELLNKIKYLIDNPLKRDNLSANARKRIEKNFSLNQMILQYENLYQEIVTE